MVPRGSYLFVLAHAAAACSDDVTVLSLSDLDQAVIVLAHVSRDRAVLDAKLVDPSARATFFAFSEGDTLHAFALDRTSLRDAAGQPLDSAALAELSVAFTRSESPINDICPACPFPADAPPFVLEPGSRCALPTFFEHRQSGDVFSDEAIEQIRAKLRIERAPNDACACVAQTEGPVRGAFSACEVEPVAHPHRWHRLALTNDGAIAAVHPSMILTATIGAAPVFHPLETSFIRSPIIAAIGERGRRFFAAGRTVTLEGETAEESFARIEGDTITVFDPIAEDGDEVTAAIFDPTRDALFLLGPSQTGGEARIWRCDRDITRCTGMDIPRCGTGPSGSTKHIANAIQLASGDLLALTLDFHLVELRAGSDTWECRTADRSALRSSGGIEPRADTLRSDSVSSALIAGDRLFACGVAVSGDGVPYSTVLNATFRANETPWHEGQVTLWGEINGARCHGLWHDRQNNEVLAFFFRDDTPDVFAFDTAGRFLSRRTHLLRFPELREPVALVVESPDRRSRIAAGVYGALWFERDGQPAVMVGDDAPNTPSIALADADRALIFGSGRAPIAWNGGCDQSSVEVLAPIQRESNAAALLSDGRIVIISSTTASIYDRANGELDVFAIDAPNTKAAATITEDELVLLDSSGVARVLSLSERRIRALPLESAPGVADDRELRFSNLSGARGVGWLSGGAELARVRVGPSGLRAELWWGARIKDGLALSEVVETYAASAALCGGRTVLFVRARLGEDVAGPWVASTVLLEPGPRGDYHPRVLPGFDKPGRFGTSSFPYLARLISASLNPVLAFDGGLVFRPDSDPYYSPSPELTSIVEARDGVVLTDRAGNRIFLRAP